MSLHLSSYPIDDVLPELKKTVLDNNAVVLHAPPGAGKTTRVPLALLDIMPPEKGRIIILEPRRLAAVSAAGWMAKIMGEQAGGIVGFSIRFESRISASTRIEVVTEGILTRRIQSDPSLEGVAMVIFDEFHERSMQADLALALCLDIRKNLREDLKIIVMSATMDCGPVSALLGNAPVITSVGRAFPVEEHYLEDRNEAPLRKRVVDAVSTALNKTAGDILVFLPGSGEIRACTEALAAIVGRMPDISVHPLYGDLSFDEQERAILPSEKRKIVLATNIAETSLTIEGVRVVVDSGLTRRLLYEPSSGMNRLITVSVSKASAEQRKGRAGRLGPGDCYRLFSRYSFQSMTSFSAPEILMSDLSSLVLELAAWGIKDPSELSWLDTPPAGAWNSAQELLIELGAIGQSGSVTAEGREMARMPVPPRLARMMLRARELGCPGLGTDIAALLSGRDILYRGAAGNALYQGDPGMEGRLDVLRAWRKDKKRSGRSEQWAEQWALRTADMTSKQLVRLLHTDRKILSEDIADHDMTSRLLLRAYPDRVAMRREGSEDRFILALGRGVKLSRESANRDSRFIIAVNADSGEKGEGLVHLAEPVTEDLVRQECGGSIKTGKRIEWDRRELKIIAAIEERLGALLLFSRPFNPTDDEAIPILCEAIRSGPGMISFSKQARLLQGRVSLMRRTFPEETWPDLSDERLLSAPEDWLAPYLGGIRNKHDLAGLDTFAALKAQLAWEQARLLDERAPVSIVVPSGSRVTLDYNAGEVPVLAVKLQEMFGLADTPVVADGRVKVLIHLLSPARRPVQVTSDLKGFWDNGYQLVKKELKGRYPKHPWPDNPWDAAPTRKVKASSPNRSKP